MKYQFLPPLDADQRHALWQSIEANGVLQPVEVDEHGEILDGHHRAEIAAELGIDYPTRVVDGLDETAKRQYAVTVNVARRQLTPTMRGALVAQLRTDGMSIRAIAAVTGLTKSTVANDVAQLSNSGQLNQPERITSLDGKERPATQPARTQTPALMPEPEATRPSVDVTVASGLNSPTGSDQPGRIPVAGLPTGPVGVELPEAGVLAARGAVSASPASGTNLTAALAQAQARRAEVEQHNAWVRELDEQTPAETKAAVEELGRRIKPVTAIESGCRHLLDAVREVDPERAVAEAPDRLRHHLDVVAEALTFLTRVADAMQQQMEKAA